MSRSKVFLFTLLLSIMFVGNAIAQSDDVYYDPKSNDNTRSSSPDYQQQHDNQGSPNSNNQQYNDHRDGYNNNSTSGQSYSGNNYSNNNNGGSYSGNTYSNGANDDDYYYDNDYNYTTRLRRYYSPGYAMSYYDDWYTPTKSRTERKRKAF